MDHFLLARDDSGQYSQYYQYLALCDTNYCPDAYYDFIDHCTVEICPIDSSNYNYLPSLAANGIFIALFCVSLVCYLGQGLLSKRFIGFTVAMVCGGILEVLGYAGRIMSHNNPWSQVSAYVAWDARWPSLIPRFPVEWLFATDHLSDYCTSLFCCRNLSHIVPYRDHVWCLELSDQASILPPDFHPVRYHLARTTSNRWRHGERGVK